MVKTSELCNMHKKVLATISEHNLLQPDDAVLLMVSGGSDSTALAYIAHKLHTEEKLGPLAMLHVNHLLRKEDANTDARFVKNLANLLDIPLFSYEIDIFKKAEETGENVEAVARRERYLAAYEALESMCLNLALPLSSAHLMVAHTADDRIENFYMRSIVGTGPGGFRSMRYSNGPVVRPLLDLGRDDLRAYIKKRAGEGLPVVRDASGNLWREDATNAHTDRFRAFVRHEIVPLAKGRNEKLIDVLCRSMNLIADEDDMLEDATDTLIKKHIRWIEQPQGCATRNSAGCVLAPELGTVPIPLMRRVIIRILHEMLGRDTRIDTASVNAVISAWDGCDICGGYVTNIQGNLAVSANKRGVRIEPMNSFRERRKRV